MLDVLYDLLLLQFYLIRKILEVEHLAAAVVATPPGPLYEVADPLLDVALHVLLVLQEVPQTGLLLYYLAQINIFKLLRQIQTPNFADPNSLYFLYSVVIPQKAPLVLKPQLHSEVHSLLLHLGYSL